MLTCLFNPPDALLEPVHSSLNPGGGASLVLSVTMPKYRYEEEPSKKTIEVDSRVVAVTLVAEKGVWKIDRVTDQGVKP